MIELEKAGHEVCVGEVLSTRRLGFVALTAACPAHEAPDTPFHPHCSTTGKSHVERSSDRNAIGVIRPIADHPRQRVSVL